MIGPECMNVQYAILLIWRYIYPVYMYIHKLHQNENKRKQVIIFADVIMGSEWWREEITKI